MPANIMGEILQNPLQTEGVYAILTIDETEKCKISSKPSDIKGGRLMVILWICVLFVCSAILSQGDASREEIKQNFYCAEYRHCYPAE